jgi:hypothetical protein
MARRSLEKSGERGLRSGGSGGRGGIADADIGETGEDMRERVLCLAKVGLGVAYEHNSNRNVRN